MVNDRPLVLMVHTTVGWTGGPAVMTAAAPPFLVLALNDPLV